MAQLCGAIVVMIIAGIIKHEIRMKMLQTFSHSQRPKNRMGRVKDPFITPEKMARDDPITRVSLNLYATLIPDLNLNKQISI